MDWTGLPNLDWLPTGSDFRQFHEDEKLKKIEELELRIARLEELLEEKKKQQT